MSRKESQKYESLKPDFMSSTLTLREFADVHGVSYDALRQTAASGRWIEERRKLSQAVTKAATESTATIRIKELSKYNEDDLKMAKLLRGMVAKNIESATKSGKNIKPSELKTLSGIVVDAQKIARLALGANTESHEIGGLGGLPMQMSNVPIEEYRLALQEVMSRF